MKRVSFEVAKAIKKAGYPQGETDNTRIPKYYGVNGKFVKLPISGEQIVYFVPTYLDVWLWLWRAKGFRFELAHPEDKGEYDFNKIYCNITSGSGITDDYSDPEEAIIEAVEYLVNNNLIK